MRFQGEVEVCSLLEFHLRDMLRSRLLLDSYGLFKMVFDCLWVVLDVFEVVVESFEVLVGGCRSFLLL